MGYVYDERLCLTEGAKTDKLSHQEFIQEEKQSLMSYFSTRYQIPDAIW